MDEISSKPESVPNPPVTTPVFSGLSPKPGPKIKPLLVICVLLVLGALGVAGFYIFRTMQRQKPQTSPTTDTESPKAVFNLGGAAFAEYKEVQSTVKPSLQSYTLSVSELSNLNAVASAAKIQMNTDKTSALEKNGFFLQPAKIGNTDPNMELDIRYGGRIDDMIDLYSQFGGETSDYKRRPENAVFISSDFLLHIYHVLIDRTFQKIEEDKFQPTLKELTQKLYEDSLNRYTNESDPQIKESLKRLTAFYLVPLSALHASLPKKTDYFGTYEEQESLVADDQSADSAENIANSLNTYKDKTPAEIFTLASQELDLVVKANGLGISPIYSTLKPDWKEDYSQYKPRGHYTKNSVLRSYFRAMMWYGRHGFDLKSVDLTRDAVIMTLQLGSTTVGEKPALGLWEYIYLPTVFFVGRSDDLTFYDYSDLIKKVYGDNVNLSSLQDKAKLQQLREEAQKLEGPKILSEVKVFDPGNAPTKEELLNSTKGFRFMGQRFIPDSYMFASLTQGDEQPDPETGQKLPSTPTALMVMSLLGSKTADTLLNDWVATEAPQSDKIIAKVKKQLASEFAKFDEKTWTQNIYWSWLYNLLPLFSDHGDGYPMFMRNLAWGKKSLLSALGSWTELRHDTLLYAKQSYAEMGGGRPDEEVPPVPKGYVEPNLSFLTRLIALNTMTMEGLEGKELLAEGLKERFERFNTALEFFKSIAEKELSDSVITDEEFEKLRTMVRINFPSLVVPLEGDIMTERDARMGIIADVHTDAVKEQILYEAIGMPSIIYVAVKDKNGTRLTRGATYTYYEFTEPLQTRLSDEDWQGRIYEGKDQNKVPPVPGWTGELVKP